MYCNPIIVIMMQPIETIKTIENTETIEYGNKPIIAIPLDNEVPCDNEPNQKNICDCPVCYTQVEDYFTTECNHSFCEPCLFQVRDYHKKINGSRTFPCPLCREPIPNSLMNVKVYLPPFVATNYPVNPDFSCISSEHVRGMVQNAYECVCIQEKWLLLHGYNVDESKGFMLDDSPEICDLMNKIQDHSNGMHSGMSMGMTMRMIHYIAIYGYYKFSNIVT